jgi:antitoxin CptB
MVPAELDEFETLLEQPDQDLYAWIIGQAQCPAAFDTPLFERLRRFSRSAPMGRPGG